MSEQNKAYICKDCGEEMLEIFGLCFSNPSYTYFTACRKDKNSTKERFVGMFVCPNCGRVQGRVNDND